MPLQQAMNHGDSVLEIEITPNRGDGLSARGIARELSTLGCGRLSAVAIERDLHSYYAKQISKLPSKPIKLISVDGAQCERYLLTLIRLPKVLPTPSWIVDRLTAAGLNSINLIVDITNYLMLLWGQPMHAFDYEKLDGGAIEVRLGKRGEEIVGLDEQTYKVSTGHLLICDAKKPVCIAGVLGGQHSGVTEGTRQILLEAASFAPAVVRKACKELAINSDSSYRFERGVDHRTPELVTAATIQLLKGIYADESIDIVAHVAFSEAKKNVEQIEFRLSRFHKIMGYSVKAKQAQSILTNLGCVVQVTGGTLKVQAPSWRFDLLREIDLIEEVGRIIGFDQLPTTLPKVVADDHAMLKPGDGALKLADHMKTLGFYESKSLSFISKDQLHSVGYSESECFRLKTLLVNNKLLCVRVWCQHYWIPFITITHTIDTKTQSIYSKLIGCIWFSQMKICLKKICI